ncbi:MAG: DUF3667 domain-containing protein [Pseudohongiellaceae bacterium]
MTELTTAAVCLNCGKALSNHYCSSCGQKDLVVKRPLSKLLAEFTHAVFEIDGRAYRTLFFLFTKPGFLTREYIQGRRASYTPPLRLFLVLSLLLFFVISVNTFIETLDDSLSGQEPSVGAETLETLSDELTPELDDEELGGIQEFTDFLEAVQLPLLNETTNSNLMAFVANQVTTNYVENRDDPESFFYGSLDYITVFMLLMMPLLAAILKIMYFFSKRYYVEHMILTLHNHTFLILAILLSVLVGKLPEEGVPVVPAVASLANYALTFWMICYPFLSLKAYFDDGYLLTALKFIIASIIYSILLAVGLAIFLSLFFIFS